jgi:hypothetical protein
MVFLFTRVDQAASVTKAPDMPAYASVFTARWHRGFQVRVRYAVAKLRAEGPKSLGVIGVASLGAPLHVRISKKFADCRCGLRSG